jgi:hypothetical protein
MQKILTTGTYHASSGESFQISQDAADLQLVSGKDCKLRYYPDSRYVQATDFVQLNLCCDGSSSGCITIQKRSFRSMDIFNSNYEFEVLVKSHMLNRSGQYEFTFSFRDRFGKEITKAALPTICFSHDLSSLAGNWFPHGLVI